jgi:hypothetical protein
VQDDFILAYDKRFQRSAVEPCLYFIVSKELTILILVHVDDYVIASNSPAYRDAYLDVFVWKRDSVVPYISAQTCTYLIPLAE